MLRAMRGLAVLLVLVAAAALLACGGSIQTYWADDDAGRCVEHASERYCRVSVGPCDDGGPPDSGTKDLANAIVTCTP
jgi:hypothetical protein